MKKCKKLTYEDIGHAGSSHTPSSTEAIGPNYVKSDLSNTNLCELTIQMFGFELAEEEVVKVRDLINDFLKDVSSHNRAKMRAYGEED